MSIASTVSAAADEARDRWAREAPDPDAGRVHRAARTAQVISVIIIGVVALIGILIFDQVREGIPESALEDGAGDPNQMGESVSAIMDGFGGAMELIPVVLLVIVASLVIGVVQQMRTRS